MAEVSVEAVRQHLLQMGFHEVPDDVVHELRSELLARMSSASAAPTPSKQAPAPSQGKVAAAGGYEADESEWEHRDKVGYCANAASACGRAGGAQAETRPLFCWQENIHRGNVGAERKSTGAHGAKAKARPSGAAATSVQEASLRDKRPATAPGTSQRSRRAGADGTAHGSHGPADSTREAGAGQCHEESVKGTEEDARRSTGVGAEGRVRASVTPSSSSVFSGSRHTPAPSSSGLIRPATQSYGRAARRQDPVSSFLNTREQWKRGPAVTAGGTARGTVCLPVLCKCFCIDLRVVCKISLARGCAYGGQPRSWRVLTRPMRPRTAGGSDFLAAAARRQERLEGGAPAPEWHIGLQLPCAHLKGKRE